MRLREFWRRVVFLVQRNRRLRELDEELRLHADLRAACCNKRASLRNRQPLQRSGNSGIAPL